MATADAPAMNGAYRYTDQNGNVTTWIIRTECTPGCFANVTTSPGHGFTAPLVNGMYTVARTVPDGVTCPLYPVGETYLGGGRYPVVVRQFWDARTLAGGVDFLDSPAPCGIPTPHNTFTLVKIG